MNITKQKTKQQIVNIILSVLLLERYSSEYLFKNILDERMLALAKSLNLSVIFTLILITIWIKKDKLYELNIDKTSFFIILVSAAVLVWMYVPFVFGVFVFAAIAVLTHGFYKNLYQFSKSNIFSLRSLGLLICVPIPLLPFLYISYSSSNAVITYSKILAALTEISFFGVIFEEFLFRSILWMFLRNQNVNEHKIIVFQAILFWLAHYPSMFDKWLSFWIAIPFVSVILGIMVFRSKSITMSTIAHLLYNFLVVFL